MAKPPVLKRIKTSDFPAQPGFRVLVNLYNQFISETVDALRNRLTFRENFDGIVKSVVLDGTYPVRVSWPRPSRPIGLWAVNLTRVDLADTSLSAGYVVEWEYENNQIVILNVPGLTASASDQYQLTFIAIAG